MNAHDHKAWNLAGLKDFGDFADCVEYVNQQESGYGDYEGDWFYGDDETRTLYYGSFGNDHSPGASSYTHADQYETEEEYRADLAKWEACPEYVETDEDDEEDCDEDDEEDC